jgi:superoxide dismutase, Fe-Mn family
LVVDAWEHAYYLQYQTEKEKYFEALGNLWNWRDVEARYERAVRFDLGLSPAADDQSASRPQTQH